MMEGHPLGEHLICELTSRMAVVPPPGRRGGVGPGLGDESAHGRHPRLPLPTFPMQ